METLLIELQAAAPKEAEERAVFFTGKAFGMARGAVACRGVRALAQEC